MRNNLAMITLVGLLLTIALLLTGCGFFNQPGKTAEEVHREHLRMLRINQQEMMRDIDRTLGVDQPSKLTDKKIP
jgi:outer membrane lipopolysaccharide assembly protein LptE/RlpB